MSETIRARKFRKKPLVIDAVQWTGTNADEVLGFTLGRASVRDESFRRTSPSERVLVIETLEGSMRAEPWDWIICGVKGEFYSCKPDIFEATYERVGDEVAAALVAPQAPAPADHDAIQRLALEYHRTQEGEYGCPGFSCPGVQRLTVFGRACADLPKLREAAGALRAAVPTDTQRANALRDAVCQIWSATGRYGHKIPALAKAALDHDNQLLDAAKEL